MLVLDEQRFRVRAGERLYVPCGVFHGFETQEEPLVFISIQSPPILNKTTQILDLEPLGAS